MYNYKDVSAIAIAEKLGIKSGNSGKYHCFNSEGHIRNDVNPSLGISDKAFHCFACGVKGNNIELVKQVLNLDTQQAFEWIKKNFGGKGIYNQVCSNEISKLKYKSNSPIEPKYIDINKIIEAQTYLDSNLFAKGLIEIGIEPEHLINWNVGSNSKGETIFYYQDINCNFVNAKQISYKKDLHRDKKISPIYLYKKTNGYGQCIYGEHLFDENTFDLPVMLVESEKTAIISSYCMPNNLWLASGGAKSFTKEKTNVLKGHTVFIAVDSDKVGRESAERTKEILNKCGINIRTIDLFKDKKNGMDLADYFIVQLRNLQCKISRLNENELETFNGITRRIQYQFNIGKYEIEQLAIQILKGEG